MAPIDSYEWYCRYYKRAYGADYPVSRETWREWCLSLERPHQAENNFDIETERREGWTY